MNLSDWNGGNWDNINMVGGFIVKDNTLNHGLMNSCIFKGHSDLLSCSIVNGLHKNNIIFLQVSGCLNNACNWLLDGLALSNEGNVIGFLDDITTLVHTNNIDVANSFHNSWRLSPDGNNFNGTISFDDSQVIGLIVTDNFKMIGSKGRCNFSNNMVDSSHFDLIILNNFNNFCYTGRIVLFLGYLDNLDLGGAHYLSGALYCVDVNNCNVFPTLIWSCYDNCGEIGWRIDEAHLKCVGVMAFNHSHRSNF